jgi:hypothetical protein
MKTETKEASFVITSDALLTTIDTCFESWDANKTTMNFVLENRSQMSFSFRDLPGHEELARRHFPHTCIKRPVQISIEFPLVTEAELQIEAERKRLIAELKADIKERESRLKALESIDTRRRYGY